jgi:type IV pilus assembly protein PilP
MMSRHFISVVTGGILVLLLAGGTVAPGLRAAEVNTLRQGVTTPPPAAPAGNSAILPANPTPAAVLLPASTYSYNAAGKADPFKPFMETEPAPKTKKPEDLKKKTAVQDGSISPLQRLDIGQYRLIGIAGDQKRCVAIVEYGAAKRYYPLFVGTFIGLNGGRVAAILPDRVIVEEKAEKQAKKAKTAKVKRVTVMLHKDEEGKP